MKIISKTIIFILCLLGFSKSLDAQTFPSWDVNNPGWSLYGDPSSEYPPDETMVATNGIVFISYGDSVAAWTQSSGWQVIAEFGDTNNPSDPPSGIPAALHLAGNFLYVGGHFNIMSANNWSSSSPVDNLVKMDLTTEAWTDLGHGNLYPNVQAITVDAKTNIYVACNPSSSLPDPCDDGSISNNVAANALTNIVLVSNGTNWSTVGGGIAGIIGSGSGAGGITPCQYDSSLLRTTEAPTPCLLQTDGTNIFFASQYVFGVNSNETLVYSPNVIKWDGSHWQAMGTNAPHPGLYNPNYWNDQFFIWSMVVSGTNVFLTGAFNGGTEGEPANYPDYYPGGITLARFTTSGSYIATAALLSTNGFPTGYYGPAGYSVLTAANGIVYVTGKFDTVQTNPPTYIIQTDGTSPINTVPVSGIAQWDGTNWSDVGGGFQFSGVPGNGTYINADAGAVYVVGLSDGPGEFNWVGGATPPNGQFVRWITASELNLIFNAQNHTLSWSWDGTTPYQWQLQNQSPCYPGWYNYQTFSGSVTSISSIGYTGTFRIQGKDSSGNPVTPWSNIQAFDDTASATLTLTHTPSTHSLSWAWNGPAPFAWLIEEPSSFFPTETWGNVVDWLPGSTTSINVSGWSGIYRIYGADINGCQVTLPSNVQAFSD